MRQLVLAGCFCDAGVKKVETAFSVVKGSVNAGSRASDYSLVVVDSTFRFAGGGETGRSPNFPSARFMFHRLK